MNKGWFHFAGSLLSICRSVAFAITSLLPIIVFGTEAPGQTEYRIYMYKNSDPSERVNNFSPHDKIHVHVDLGRLSKGAYSFRAEWYNAFGNLQDTSQHTFFLPEEKTYSVESWLKFSKAGFLTRIFSASETTGYSVKFYGKWHIKFFLNGDEIAQYRFQVQ